MVLITIRKSHIGFRLVPTSVILNDLDSLSSVTAIILRFSPNLLALQADYVTIVDDRPLMSAKYRLQLHFVITDPACSAISLR